MGPRPGSELSPDTAASVSTIRTLVKRHLDPNKARFVDSPQYSAGLEKPKR